MTNETLALQLKKLNLFLALTLCLSIISCNNSGDTKSSGKENNYEKTESTEESDKNPLQTIPLKKEFGLKAAISARVHLSIKGIISTILN